MVLSIPSADPRPSAPRPAPAWARPSARVESVEDATFLAGAALASLDAIVRLDAPYAGVWRQRLALTAAAASLRWTGRREEEGELRDAWLLRRADDDWGPAGHVLRAWRLLARRPTGLSIEALQDAADGFDLSLEAVLPEIIDAARAHGEGPGSPLAAAAAVAGEVVRLRPGAELLAYWLADLVLAQKLRWPYPLPLCVSRIAHPSVKGRQGLATPPGKEGFARVLALAYAHSAVAAVDLAGDLARRAEKLVQAAPKLRAKGAHKIVAALLEDDAIAPSARIGAMSDRGMRRLCDRLVDLGAVRELTGRPTFRLYGL